MLSQFSRGVLVAAVFAGAQLGCEDNPDQFYKKAPAGAGDIWNNGGSAPSYDQAVQNSLNENFNNASSDELCAGPIKHDRWAKMVQEPIKPISDFGMVDLRGDENWSGLYFRAAQQALCQATPDATQDDHLVAHWGDNGEVTAKYLISNNLVDEIDLNPGYEGSLLFNSRADKDTPGGKNHWGEGHKYEIKIGQTIKRDGVDFLLDWQNHDKMIAWASELYDGLMATYAPTLQGSQDDCVAPQLCRAVANNGDGTTGFGARPLGVYFYTPNGVTQPLASQPSLIYAFPVKIMPFSISTMDLKLDRQGPTATSTTNSKACNQALGMKYADFLDSCVNVATDAAENQKNVTKLLGGLAHTKEVFNFSVQGVDTDFSSSIIGEDKVVLDDWKPSPSDTVYHFNIDIRAKGPLVNDRDAALAKTTLAGTGAFLREYQMSVQEDIVALMTDWRARSGGTFKAHAIGDSACMLGPTSDPLTWGPNNGANGPAADCTGFEQMVTPGDPTVTSAGVDDNAKRMSVGSLAPGGPFHYVTLLAPGDPTGVFCTDPPPVLGKKNTLEACSADTDCNAGSCTIASGATTGFCDPRGQYFQHCGTNGDGTGKTDVILTASFDHVRNYLTTNGDLNQLPPPLRDRKFYFQHLGTAMVKYLLAAGSNPTNLRALGPNDCDGKSCTINPDHLQFDQVGTSADQAVVRYTDHRFVEEGVQPTMFEYQISIASGNQTEVRFRRYVERDETAVYKAVQEDRTKPIATEDDNVRISNLLGNPMIAGMFSGVDATRDAYYCATHADSACSPSMPLDRKTQQPVLDDNNQPLFTEYKGIFGETAFTVGTSHLSLVKEVPDFRSAQVAVPMFSTPYAPPKTTPNAAGPQVLTVLPDWRPLAPGSGFALPLNGNAQREKFFPAPQVDLSGQNISLAINFQTGNNNADHTGPMKILSVETQIFEGELFLCVDPATNDILHVRQYDSIEEIMDWLATHPGAQDGCQMQIKYNTANASPISVVSFAAGVEVFVGQGVGIGRITDALIFDPSLSQ